MLKRIVQIIWVGLWYAASRKPKPIRVRIAFEKLGGAFVKFGQILALRSDLISEKVSFELLNLLDRMPEVRIEKIRKVIKRELGQEPEELFQIFENQPLSAASFAQIHRAWTWEGEPVIVKVQKPGIPGIVKTDLLLLKYLARLMDLNFKGPGKMKNIVSEFAEWTWYELDLRLEARWAEQMRLAHENVSGVKFPKIYEQYTTRRVLVEEFVEGVNLKEIIVNGVPEGMDGDAICRRILENAMRQYFLQGRFHGDPHPGNILVGADHTIGMVDFGIVGLAKTEHRIAIANFVYHTMKGNYGVAINAFFHLGLAQQLARDLPYLLSHKKFAELFTAGFKTFKDILTRRFAVMGSRWHEAMKRKDADFKQKTPAGTFLKFLEMVGRYKVSLDRDIVMFVKTIVELDAISFKISKQFDLVKTVCEIFETDQYRPLFSEEARKKLDMIFDGVELVKPDPERAGLIRDYYTEWFGRIVEMHEQEFLAIFRKKKQAVKEEEEAAPPVHESGLPDWIVAMHKTLGHNEKFNLQL